jgi:hypothetical protein
LPGDRIEASSIELSDRLEIVGSKVATVIDLGPTEGIDDESQRVHMGAHNQWSGRVAATVSAQFVMLFDPEFRTAMRRLSSRAAHAGETAVVGRQPSPDETPGRVGGRGPIVSLGAGAAKMDSTPGVAARVSSLS